MTEEERQTAELAELEEQRKKLYEETKAELEREYEELQEELAKAKAMLEQSKQGS